MVFIPQRVLHGEFPASGVYGITGREAIELSIAGVLPAYYHIAAGFDLIGNSMVGPKYIAGSYGSFHGALARLPVGKLQYLEAQGSMTFDSTEMMQVEGFHCREFGPPARPESVRAAFEAEEFFWLALDPGATFQMVLDRVIFMREDLERLASTRPAPIAEPNPSDAALGAAIRQHRSNYAARQRETSSAREVEYERWKKAAADINSKRNRPASKRELAELVKKDLSLPDSTETIRKRIK